MHRRRRLYDARVMLRVTPLLERELEVCDPAKATLRAPSAAGRNMLWLTQYIAALALHPTAPARRSGVSMMADASTLELKAQILQVAALTDRGQRLNQLSEWRASNTGPSQHRPVRLELIPALSLCQSRQPTRRSARPCLTSSRRCPPAQWTRPA